MFVLALFWGLLSFLYFFLGITGILYWEFILFFTVAAFLLLFYVQRQSYKRIVISLLSNKSKSLTSIKQNKLITFFVVLVIFQSLVNLAGAVSPELAFDALWYHLTMPKLYLINHAVYYIPGGLLHYSAMPQLGEMLYVGALMIGDEIAVKLLHFLFGLLTLVTVYSLARKYVTSLLAVLAAVIFYSNIVVAWESTSAYIDLIRAFFEIMALWAFLVWFKVEDRKWLIISAVMVGFAICTKLLALGSIGIFIVLILFTRFLKRTLNFSVIKDLALFVAFAVIVPLPWFIYAFIYTGNPVYPLFSNTIAIHSEPISLLNFIPDVWKGFMQSSDPISPLYMIFLPLIIALYPRFSREFKIMTIYSLGAIVVWFLTPRTGGGRFLLPYLPALSILCTAALSHILKKVRMSSNYLFLFLLFVIMVTAIITIVYRFAAEIKFAPYLLGQQTKHQFLSSRLNFEFGDFYDTDYYFERNIKSDDVVLVYNFHNLYYINFPFIHVAWVKPGDKFTHIAIQHGELPERFADWQLVYSNARTKVKLYIPPEDGLCKNICVY